jgi:hypothetical protein
VKYNRRRLQDQHVKILDPFMMIKVAAKMKKPILQLAVVGKAFPALQLKEVS